MFHRFTRGRTLDEVAPYGWDLFLSALALAVWQHEASDQRFHHLDTTSFSRTGAYVPESDAPAMAITHGSSKDQRPDLQQAVLARRVSQDGGGPLASKRWDGHASFSHG
jgi:transposase